MRSTRSSSPRLPALARIGSLVLGATLASAALAGPESELAATGPADPGRLAARTLTIDEIQQTIEQLADNSYAVREQASNQLVELGLAALPAVQQATANSDAEVRTRARRIIREWAVRGQAWALLAQLKDASADVRAQAAADLGDKGPASREAVPALLELLRDPAEPVQAVAREALKRIQPMPALRMEIIDLQDPVTVGTQTAYRIDVTNTGTGPATNVRLMALAPEQMQIVQAKGATGSQQEGARLSFDSTTIAPGARHSYEVHVKCVKPGDARLRIEMTSDPVVPPAAGTITPVRFCEEETTTVLQK